MVVNSMSYATYDSYKDSGVDWLGEIPSDWDLIPNKHIFKLKNIKVGKKSSEYDLLSLTLKGVIKRDMENPEGKFPAEFDTYQEVKNGNFIFCMFDVQETPRTVGLSKFDGMITGAYTVFDVNENYNRDFLYYFYLNLDLDKRLKPLYRGLRNTIPKEWFLNFKTFVPSFKQQKAIANFLDDKTAQIDQAIALKQQQIEKLGEYKQIVIQNAVTKGLNPNAPMKNSGVEWIGNIPEHWDVKKLKYLTSKVGSGITPSGGATTYVDKGIPLLRSQNIHFDGLVLDNVANISLNVHKSMKNSQVKQHDVLLNITGGSLGRCCYNSSNDEMNVNQHVCIVRPNNLIKGEFLNGLMSSEVGQKQIWFFQQGGGREGLNFQNLKNFDFPLPSIDEQKEIIAHIEILKQHFKKSVDNYQTQIDRLKEYKNILINQAVTGKIKI